MSRTSHWHSVIINTLLSVRKREQFSVWKNRWFLLCRCENLRLFFKHLCLRGMSHYWFSLGERGSPLCSPPGKWSPICSGLMHSCATAHPGGGTGGNSSFFRRVSFASEEVGNTVGFLSGKNISYAESNWPLDFLFCDWRDFRDSRKSPSFFVLIKKKMMSLTLYPYMVTSTFLPTGCILTRENCWQTGSNWTLE